MDVRNNPMNHIDHNPKIGTQMKRRSNRNLLVYSALAAGLLSLSLNGVSMEASSAALLETKYPVTIQNCSGPITYTAAPKRVITLDDQMTDTLIQLGLSNRIVGIMKFETDAQEWSATKSVVLGLHKFTTGLIKSSGYPTLESVQALNPDMVTSVYSSAFSATYGPATQARLASLKINSYESIQSCEKDASKPLYDFSKLYLDIHNLGMIFNVQQKANNLIASIKNQVLAQQERAKSAGLGSYSISTACINGANTCSMGVGMPNAIINLTGSKYALVKDDIDPNTSVSWETYVKRNAQIFWVITDLSDSAAAIEKAYLNNPKLKSMTAVKNRAFLPVSYNEAVPSPRSVDGLKHMIDGLILLKSEHKI